MRRWCAGILGLGLLAMTGCFNQHPLTPAQQAVADQRSIERKIAIDDPRLLGEDHGHANTRPTIILGVDVTGENPLYATFDVLWNAPIKLYHFYFSKETPGQYAREMEMADLPDTQREAIFKLANFSFGRAAPYTTRYDQMAQTPSLDPSVRAAAIRALNRSRDQKATPVFINVLNEWLRRVEIYRGTAANNPEVRVMPPDDNGWLMRLEAAKALANIPDEKAVPVLVRELHEDDNKDVRIACVDALRNYRTQETANVLIDAMADRDFGIVWQARQSLIVMTGHDFHYNQSQWLNYFNQTRQPFR